MSLLYKLEYQDNFTDLEKGIANYILDHKDYIVDLKIIICYTFLYSYNTYPFERILVGRHSCYMDFF